MLCEYTSPLSSRQAIKRTEGVSRQGARAAARTALQGGGRRTPEAGVSVGQAGRQGGSGTPGRARTPNLRLRRLWEADTARKPEPRQDGILSGLRGFPVPLHYSDVFDCCGVFDGLAITVLSHLWRGVAILYHVGSAIETAQAAKRTAIRCYHANPHVTPPAYGAQSAPTDS